MGEKELEPHVTVNELRKTATTMFLVTDENVAYDISTKLNWAADEIERLRECLAKSDYNPEDYEIKV